MSRRNRKSAAQRRAKGELQLCLALFPLFAAFAAVLWFAVSTLPAGYPVNVGACIAVLAFGASMFSALFAWLALDAWGRC